MTPTQTKAPGSTVRPGFPVAWQQHADDAKLFWQQDPMHFPDPLAPMEAAMLQRTLGPGFGYGARAYSAPIERVEVRSVNGYLYQAMVPVQGTPEEMAALGGRAEQAIQGVVGRLAELWDDEVLPEVAEHLAAWDAFDLVGASRSELAAHLEETWTRLRRVWELHFVTVLPVYLAISEWDELYRGLFPDSGPLDSYKLLEGLPNMTVEVGQELWQLSRRALASDEVRRVLEDTPSAEVPATLGTTAEGRAFLADLREYLEHYGRRADKWTITAPSWTEDPTPAIETLREFARRSDADAPDVMTQLAAVGRDRAIAEARERLAGYPAAIIGQFEAMLSAAQIATVLTEDHNFWIDNMTIHHFRAVLLACGARLVQDGAVVRAEDVLMLQPGRRPAAGRRAPGGRDGAPARAAAARGPRDAADPAAAGRRLRPLRGEVLRRAAGRGRGRGRAAWRRRVGGPRPRHRADHPLDRRRRASAARRHPGRGDHGAAVDAAVRDRGRRGHRHRRRAEPLRRRRPRVRHPGGGRHRCGLARDRRRPADRGRR
jgi:hypothetical protein